MKNKLLIFTPFLLISFLTGCNNIVKEKVNYISKYVYEVFGDNSFTNETTYEYSNNFKTFSYKVKKINDKGSPTDVTYFTCTRNYNDKYQIESEINEDFTFGYYKTTENYKYNSKNLLEEYKCEQLVEIDGEPFFASHEGYVYDSENRLILTNIYNSRDEIIEKYVYEYEDNKVTSYFFDFDEDKEDPKEVIETKTEIDKTTNNKTITKTYKIIDYVIEEYINSINVYNSKGYLIKEEKYNRVSTYEYNSNNDVLLKKDFSRNDFGEEEKLYFMNEYIYDENDYIKEENQYFVENNVKDTTPNLTYKYICDEKGRVTSYSEYYFGSEMMESKSTYYFLDEKEEINPALKGQKAIKKGSYNKLLID